MRTRFDPGRWRPPPAPDLTGRYAVNDVLDHLELWPLPDGAVGPEDVLVDRDGTVYTGVEDGRILRLADGGRTVAVVAQTDGRPLGIEFGRDGTLVVSDARRGLLWVEIATGRVHDLVTTFNGRPLLHVDNASVANDGTVYFSDSSTRYTYDDWRTDIAESRPNGRLLAYDPASASTRVVLDGLFYANGVALGPDESFVVVAETARYRLRRVWLSGPRRGEDDILVDNLPGFPDNVVLSPRGFFWVALANRRIPLLDRVLPHPWARRLEQHLPESIGLKPSPYPFALGIDMDGDVVANLQGPAGGYGFMTGVREHDGWLYLGSLEEAALARARLPVSTIADASRRSPRRTAQSPSLNA